MSYYGTDVISVQTRGTAESAFVSATFTASVTQYGATGPAAKMKAEPIIEQLKQAILAHAEDGGIDTSRLKTTFAVDIHRNREQEFAGYKATYTIEFTGKNVVNAPAVHDALTSIEGVASPTPVYNLADSPAEHARAFKEAVEKAKVKFEGQCAALGLDARSYSVQTYTIREETPRGKGLSFTEAAGAVAAGGKVKPIGLEPGKALLELHVEFAYKKVST